MEYIANLVGIDYVGLGPDIIEPHNFLTKQGWLEGVFYVVRESHSVENVNGPGEMPQFMESFTEGLIEHGFKDAEHQKDPGRELASGLSKSHRIIKMINSTLNNERRKEWK